jgi:hypothetical protein
VVGRKEEEGRWGKRQGEWEKRPRRKGWWGQRMKIQRKRGIVERGLKGRDG